LTSARWYSEAHKGIINAILAALAAHVTLPLRMAWTKHSIIKALEKLRNDYHALDVGPSSGERVLDNRLARWMSSE
jgi:hypothetical protein